MAVSDNSGHFLSFGDGSNNGEVGGAPTQMQNDDLVLCHQTHLITCSLVTSILLTFTERTPTLGVCQDFNRELQLQRAKESR